jgi:hypothetical protein
MPTDTGDTGTGQSSNMTDPATDAELDTEERGVALLFRVTTWTDTMTLSVSPKAPAGNTAPEIPSAEGAVTSESFGTMVSTGGSGPTYGDSSIETETIVQPGKGRAPMSSSASFSATPATGNEMLLDSSTVKKYVPC